MKPGPRNLITDVAGIRIGNAEDHHIRTGVTVILPDRPVTAAVDVRGGGPGTRETDALDPNCLVDAIHAIVLSGGSAFGLEAASAAVDWLVKRGRGFRVGEAVIPIVPSAILFDMLNGGDKDWGDSQPYRRLAGQAMDTVGEDFHLGNSGAGLGAAAGPLKGGLGSASVVDGGGVTVGAVVAVNSFGSVTMPGSPVFWAWPLEQDGEFGGRGCKGAPEQIDFDYSFGIPPGTNTTLAVVATDLALDKAQAGRVAIMAHDGLARAIRPVHTPLDGDTVFVVSTGARPLQNPVADVAMVGMMAADVVARAIARGVFEADSTGDIGGYRSLY